MLNSSSTFLPFELWLALTVPEEITCPELLSTLLDPADALLRLLSNPKSLISILAPSFPPIPSQPLFPSSRADSFPDESWPLVVASFLCPSFHERRRRRPTTTTTKTGTTILEYVRFAPTQSPQRRGRRPTTTTTTTAPSTLTLTLLTTTTTRAAAKISTGDKDADGDDDDDEVFPPVQTMTTTTKTAAKISTSDKDADGNDEDDDVLDILTLLRPLRLVALSHGAVDHDTMPKCPTTTTDDDDGRQLIAIKGASVIVAQVPSYRHHIVRKNVAPPSW